MATKTGYVSGSDLLIKLAGYCIGHCSTHTLTFNTETKERNVKPVVTKALSSSKWKNKGVSSQSISLSAEGIQYYGETEAAKAAILTAYNNAESITLEAFEREDDSTPYLVGAFIITKFEETAPANDDATFSIEAENDGEPDTFDPSVITSSSTEQTEGSTSE